MRHTPYGGLDLSSTTDITAFVLVFPPLDEEDKFYLLPYFWIPEETLDLRVRRDHVPYDVWERQGFLQTTEGNVVHYGGQSGAGMIPGNLFTIPEDCCLYKRVLPGQDSLQIYRIIFSASNHP